MATSNIRKDFKPSEFKSEWIKNKITEETIQYLENFGYYLCDIQTNDKNETRAGRNAVTSAQLRNVYSEIKRIETKLDGEDLSAAWEAQQASVLLLRPKIAYNAARVLAKNDRSKIKAFREVFETALTHVNTYPEFERFSQFAESVIAYHKVYVGKE